MENAETFQRIDQQALDGEITEDAFVKAMFLQEWKAMERTRKWYVEVYLPHAKKYELQTNPENWFCSWWGSADTCFARYTDRTAYPWTPYSSYFRATRDYGSIGRFFKDAAGAIRNVNALLNRE